ncbi:retrotransposon unclassified, putative [Babesia ovata]|uniref:Retrotransposon unclassified, putative n=1 Tax=Babesia ovata TaxID=189622 RepID=A0A2H6KED8_9APIC|nr:retrotransposon unclassified, putative [Babesia ovata]GBE61356.1 retrotransposon unclassified, putative [Babesia ovata]
MHPTSKVNNYNGQRVSAVATPTSPSFAKTKGGNKPLPAQDLVHDRKSPKKNSSDGINVGANVKSSPKGKGKRKPCPVDHVGGKGKVSSPQARELRRSIISRLQKTGYEKAAPSGSRLCNSCSKKGNAAS